jgi:hypothetical protein
MSSNNGLYFYNEKVDDFMIFTSSPTQSIHMGTNPSIPSFPSAFQVSYNSNITSNIAIFYANVGINNSNPLHQLDVKGNARVTGLITASNVNADVYMRNNTPIVFSQWNNNTGSNYVFITNSNVGIGTTFPRQTLDVVGSMQAAQFYTSNAVMVNASLSNTTSYNYAFTQNSNGETTINCVNGTAINFTMSNNQRMKIQSNAISTVSTFPFSDSQSILGNSNARWTNVYSQTLSINPLTINGPGLTVLQASCNIPILATYGDYSSNIAMKFQVQNTSNVMITSSNVEISAGHLRFIGTKAASDLVDGSVRFDRCIAGADSNGFYAITRGATVSNQNQLLFVTDSNNTNSGFNFIANPSTSLLYISASNRRVGINNSNPSTTLDITGNVNIVNTSGPNITTTYNAGDLLTTTAGGTDRYGIGQYSSNVTRVFTSGTQNGSIRFSKPSDSVTSSNAGFADMMTVTSSGNIGAGVNSPAYNLDMIGNLNVRGGLITNTTGDISIQARSNSSRLTVFGSNNDSLQFMPADNTISTGYRYFQLQNYGLNSGTNGSGLRFGLCNNPFTSPVFATIETYNTGTATIMPHISFRANGTERCRITGDTGDFIPGQNNVYNLGSSSNMWQAVYSTNGVISISDSSQKIYTPLAYGLSDIEKVSTIKYKWKDSTDNQEYYGCIANELDTIFSELVYNQEKPYKINYMELIPVLINAVKELSQGLKDIREEIKDIKSQPN